MFKQLKTSFTLIELLIVIGVIAILSAGIIIGVRDATRAARETAALVFSTTMKKTMITDMVGEWTFDDETNPGYDSSGKGNNGTLVGPPTWTADGKVRGALEFNGTIDYVNCGSDDSLDITDAITIEAWVKSSQTSEDDAVIIGDMAGSSINRNYNLRNRYGKVFFEHGDGANSDSIITDNVIFDGYWKHIVFTGVSKGAVKIFVNGVSVKSGSFSYDITPTAGSSVKKIGGGFDFFNGTIDEVCIYGAALEASQIKARYVKGLDKLYSKGKLNGKEYYQRLTETGF